MCVENIASVQVPSIYYLPSLPSTIYHARAFFLFSAPSTCSNGIPGVSDGDVCCLEACGQCGGVGCSAIAGTNGASDCCPDTIKQESGGVFCGEAPCVMAGFTPSPLNPAFDGTAAPVGEFFLWKGVVVW